MEGEYLPTYESMDLSLTASGYILADTAAGGARYYVKCDSPSFRVAHYLPNVATASWCSRFNVEDYRVAAPNDCPTHIDDGRIEFPTIANSWLGYHEDTSAITRSMLSEFLVSRRDFYEIYIAGTKKRKQPTNAMHIGTLGHAVMLDKTRLETMTAIYPTRCLNVRGGLKPHEAAAFRSSIGNRIAVKQETFDNIERMIAAVKKTALGEVLSNPSAICEKIFEATIQGVHCKCRPDFIHENEDEVLCYDLKFGAIRPDEFWRVAKSNRYWLQDNHYSAILRKNFNKPVRFWFWAIETVYPNRVFPYYYTEPSRDQTSTWHLMLLDSMRQCQETGDWSDAWESGGSVGTWEFDKPGASRQSSRSDEEGGVEPDLSTEYEVDEDESPL